MLRTLAALAFLGSVGCSAPSDSWYAVNRGNTAHRNLSTDEWDPVIATRRDEAIARLENDFVVELSVADADAFTGMERSDRSNRAFLIRGLIVDDYLEVRRTEDFTHLVVYTEDSGCSWGWSPQKRLPIVVYSRVRPEDISMSVLCDSVW